MSEEVKEVKPKRIITIVAGKDDFIDTTPQPVPQALQFWSSGSEVSKDYVDMLNDILMLSRAIAKKLNEGPEVRDSIMKRITTLKSALETILNLTYLDAYHRLGIIQDLNITMYAMIFENRMVKTEQMAEEMLKARATAEMKQRGAAYIG